MNRNAEYAEVAERAAEKDEDPDGTGSIDDGLPSPPKKILSAHYEQISSHLGIPVGTLKNQVSRLRERWRKLLFDEVGTTLEEPTTENIRGELTELLSAV